MTKALEGIRILDLSRIWAGPYATKLMADMGADIIKIESVDRMDTTRGGINPPSGSGNYPEAEPGEDPWNRNGWFNSLHLSKYGVTINLAKEGGKDLFSHLVTISDAVIENYRLGVLARLGFDYEKLRSLRPDIVLISMPAFGNKGRWKGFVQYGIGQEQLSGMADMTGYLDEDGPMKSGINHGDPITGSHAAGAMLASLLYRQTHRPGRVRGPVAARLIGLSHRRRHPGIPDEQPKPGAPRQPPSLHGAPRHLQVPRRRRGVGGHRRRLRRGVATAVRRNRTSPASRTTNGMRTCWAVGATRTSWTPSCRSGRETRTATT